MADAVLQARAAASVSAAPERPARPAGPGRASSSGIRPAAPPPPRRAPIAVVGMSCRFPRAADPAAYWRLLRDGVDAVSDAPPARRAAVPAHGPALARGGYLDAIDGFDAGFFGVSPREAAAMDPQQRLALELGWEALEDAGIVPATLKDSDAGVFIGAIWDDYAFLASRYGPRAVGPHGFTGLRRSGIANRVSATLGLHGPSLAIDTAHSSSLVAVHLACQALLTGEADLALAGGVNLRIAPEHGDAAAPGGPSPEGCRRTPGERADGCVRGEGGGLAVLKPLHRALADGDRVHCVILGSAVNHDGATGDLTVPSSTARADVLERAYEAAGRSPGEAQYVELHGVGTRLGDDTEAAALGEVLGARRPSADPLAVGSVTPNIGHLEAAAGIAGLLKTALAVRHRELPPTLRHRGPDPATDLDGLRLRVQTRAGAWPHPERPLVAGVSSFGVGGTNCHVVLGEAPRPEPTGP
ncbi:polyketide synthase [Streptomyces sp. B1866]|uniref:beta-ketoacyl [acyl carrier protein] synthase domain-containing protein n=1 Tax=Streptomyces sp. B1866 TaxID=3075431 RepID=UPI00289264EB|nr:polyketide synthase [Streptomyces sp. B1866]MDT3397512.1 polyketide synthase [Streptomyces sp. B1866]